MNHELQKRVFSSFILIPIVFYVIVKGSIFFTSFISICLLITLYEWHMMSKKMSYYIAGIVFILISFYSVFLLRNYDHYTNILDPGLTFFLIVTLICIFTDIGGYIFGKSFKGPKLTKISPNKTYAGSFGGFILAVVASLIYSNYINSAPWLKFPLQFFELTNNYETIFLIFVLLISLVSQVGDLIISYFKRLSKIKDTGKIIPGHGGLLDRADGMIFAFPFTYLILIIDIL